MEYLTSPHNNTYFSNLVTKNMNPPRHRIPINIIMI